MLIICTLQGHYIYAEVSHPVRVGHQAELRSPQGLLAGQQGSLQLTFWYHMMGTSVGTLAVTVVMAQGQQQPPPLFLRQGQGE